MRGVDDNEILSRIREFLPTLQDLLETCEDRHAARQAAREAAATAQHEQAPPADLQQLVQQAVQQALAAQASGQVPEEPLPAQPPQEQPVDAPEGYCALHQVSMEQRSNTRGSWYSHIATDEEGNYFCKGTGRSRRNSR